MATQIVELTGDEASLLRSLDKVIQKQLEMERKLRDTGQAGDAAGTSIEAAMAKVEAEATKSMKGLLAELRTVGPEGQAASAALREHLQGAGKAGMRSFDAMIAQLRLIDPEAADSAQAAADAMKQAGQDSQAVWNDQLNLLRQLGPEGAAAAKQIEMDMRVAASEAAGGIDGILGKLEQINPTAAASAQKVRSEFAAAANFSEREFSDVLNELRSMGPEGRKAAEEIRRELVQAGRIAEKSMSDVVAKLDGIDPAVAAQARSIVANMKNAGTESSNVLDSLAGKVGSYVAGIGAAATAVELVRKAWEQVRKEQDTGLQALKGTQISERTLLQVSTSNQDFAANRKMRDDLSQQFGVDQNVVSQVVFDAISLGFKQNVPEIVRASQVLDPEAASAAGGKLAQLFDKENLSATQTISSTLTASAASVADFEDLARALPSAAEGGRQLGASFAETVASVAVLTTDFKDASVAADRFKAFASKAAQDERFKGKDITQVVQEVSELSDEDRKSFLKDSMEVNAFYSAALDRLSQIREQATVINQDIAATAQGSGALNEKIGIAERDPVLIALRAENVAQQKLLVSQAQQKGEEGATASAAAANVERKFLVENDNIVTRTVGGVGLTNVATGAAALLGEDENTSTAIGVGVVRGVVEGFSRGIFGPGVEKLSNIGRRESEPDPNASALLAEQRRQTELLERQNQILEQTAANTTPRQSSPPAVTPALSAQQP
jgi:hypothetical protein